MLENKDTILKKEALHQIQCALRRTALLYHYFSETLINELGEEKGTELIHKAVEAYGTHIGQEAQRKAREKSQALIPENFESDLPELAWKTEAVVVDGEERMRVHHCPLAAEWLTWGQPEKARLYCFVDQAKMKAYNPDYEYIHIKNILDGDPYCELAVRPVKKDKEEKKEAPPDLKPGKTVRWAYGRYTREDLMKMDPVCLRALFRERVHHTIEVEAPFILLEEQRIPPNFGLQPQMILDVWKERGFPDNDPDFTWGKVYLSLAKTLREGKTVFPPKPKSSAPFDPGEIATVAKLLWGRRSIRNWIPFKKIPKILITQILAAGRTAPNACNLEIVRFIVIKDEEEAKMVWSDIPTPMNRCILIVVCYDTRVYKTVGHDRLVSHNQLFDCAAAADHMCLMAHALGLGAVWLSQTKKTRETFKKKYGLPDYIEPALHIAVGWPATRIPKSSRMPLKEMMITRKQKE